MENNLGSEEITLEEAAYSGKRKAWLEIKDVLSGAAFPFIITVIFSATIIAFTCGEEIELYLRLIALIGGELMLAGAFFMFGRANGSEAYKKTVENGRKRELHSSDEKVAYRTGEYALWKGAVIGLLVCIPYVIVLTVEICVDNSFCMFCLQYVFSWGYGPLSFAERAYLPLGYVMIIFPVAFLTVSYYFGKLRQIKIQEQLAATNPDDKRSRVVNIPGEKKGKNNNNKNGGKGRKK